jgi:hypothetical protein
MISCAAPLGSVEALTRDGFVATAEMPQHALHHRPLLNVKPGRVTAVAEGAISRELCFL